MTDREPFLEGIRLFNERKFWEAHEAWEEVWLPLGGGEERFYGGLIQLAAGLHHLTQTGRWHAAARMFDEAQKKLEAFRPRHAGIDVDDLIARVERLGHAAREERQDEGLFFELRAG